MADLIVIPLHCTMPDLDAAEVAFQKGSCVS